MKEGLRSLFELHIFALVVGNDSLAGILRRASVDNGSVTCIDGLAIGFFLA